jgi:hypothetical protein
MATEAANVIADGALKVSPLRFLMGANFICMACFLQLLVDLPQALPQGVCPMEAYPKADAPPDYLDPWRHPSGWVNTVPSTTGGYDSPRPVANTPNHPFLSRVKKYANCNACYLCDFDVPNGNTSMTCPANMGKALHDVYFTCQNAQQCINLGHPCCTKNRHKTQMPSM